MPPLFIGHSAAPHFQSPASFFVNLDSLHSLLLWEMLEMFGGCSMLLDLTGNSCPWAPASRSLAPSCLGLLFPASTGGPA